MAGKVPEVGVLGTAEKKVKILEQQRMEVGGWTGWSVSTLLPSWDQRDEGSAWLSGSHWSQVILERYNGDHWTVCPWERSLLIHRSDH